jgi:hypothetical protein
MIFQNPPSLSNTKKERIKMKTFLLLLAFPALAVTSYFAYNNLEGVEPQTDAVSEPISPIKTVIVGNGDPKDPCTVEIHESTLSSMDEIGIREWVIACEKARDSASHSSH